MAGTHRVTRLIHILCGSTYIKELFHIISVHHLLIHSPCSQCISLPICAVASTALVQACSRNHFLLGFRLNNIIVPICFRHCIVIDYNVPKLVHTIQFFLLIDVVKVKQTTLSCSHSGFLKHLRSLGFLHSSDME